MKTLILLRHAKAAAGEPDHARPLTERGRADAARAGSLLKDAGLDPAAVLVSDARRTRETYEGAAAVLGNAGRLRIEHRLYEASVDTILDLVRASPEDAGSLLIVGHNPGIGETARLLATQGASAPLADLRTRFATGTSAVIDFDLPVWSQIGRNGKLRALLLAGQDP